MTPNENEDLYVLKMKLLVLHDFQLLASQKLAEFAVVGHVLLDLGDVDLLLDIVLI